MNLFLFWAIALALVALTLAVVLWPLLRRADVAAPSEELAAAAVYRDQKRQLDADLASGAIDATEHGIGVAELAQRLGVELGGPAAPPPRSGIARIAAAFAAVAIIPAAAIVLYLALGTPDALRAVPAHAERPTDAQIVGMVETLAQKMKANPADPQGWRLLGRSYRALGRFGEASEAYAQAAQHGADDAELYAEWAQTVALGQNGMTGEPEALARKALDRDAHNLNAKALLATAAYEHKDYDRALALWREVQAELPPGSENATQVATAIERIERARTDAGGGREAGGKPGNATRASAAGAAAPGAATAAGTATATGASAAADSATTSTTPGAQSAIAGRVELAPALASRVTPGDTLFVYARASTGPRMPLAIVRRTAADLPLEFRLDDSMGMGGGPRLSSAAAVIIEARISRSGQATPQPGDLTGHSGEVRPGTSGVRVVIDQIMP